MPFDYYENLSASERRTYRESDQIAEVDLGDRQRLEPHVRALQAALEAGDRRLVQRASAGLARGLTDALGVSAVRVRVGEHRPIESDGGELYGRCSWEEEETKGALVEIWMRTAARGQVVAFRTFLRTLLHELCHHLDYELHGLDATFHTEGFFRRESSLFRQLAGPSPPRRPRPAPEPEPEPAPAPRSPRSRKTATADPKAEARAEAEAEAPAEAKAEPQLTLPF